ncbi:MAG: FecR family protein [Cyclobacteriaceae bacterium]|nr:FecR family protein [Cyclobacteriaceae bacterium]
MKYEDYSVEDFIKDDFFVEWVNNPNSKSNEFWSKWMASHPNQVAAILKAQQFITSLRYNDFEALKEEEYLEMFENVLKRKPLPFAKKLAKGQINFRLKVAAAITFLLISFLAYSWHAHKSTIKPVTKELIQYSKINPIGQKLLITLPDGSTIKLNSGSSLTYNSNFGINDRFVELKGEAFFDVVKNPTLPFIIKSGELQTKVLGTSFNVRFYGSEKTTQVLVVRGEVSVSDELGSSFVLNPKDLLEYTHYDKNVKKSICTDIQSIIGWKDGILSFHNESFSEVCKKIQRWYGVDIKVAKGANVKGFYTGDYQNMSLEKVLDGISFASEFDYKIINENKILITKKL